MIYEWPAGKPLPPDCEDGAFDLLDPDEAAEVRRLLAARRPGETRKRRDATRVDRTRRGGAEAVDAGPLTADACAALLDVSRETQARLEAYVALLGRWQARINLVGPATLADPWRRHVLDCGQLYALLPPGARVLVDLGSGAGLPGLILAILGVPEVHLIESDRRKAQFLREAARAAAVDVTVHAARAEDVPAFVTDVVAARALAPLARLLPLAARFTTAATVQLWLKGRRADEELAEAAATWRFAARRRPSRSDPSGVIIELRNLAADSVWR